jgi:Fe-S oxidoreductase
LGFAQERSMPLLHKITLRKWINSNLIENKTFKKEIVLFIDEFTNYNDTDIGITTIRLLTKLGYKVNIVQHADSGRTYLSKGLLRKAKKIAISNVLQLKDIVSKEKPLVGIEPSAILTFRDEYPDLVGDELRDSARLLALNTLTIDEFFVKECEVGGVDKQLFTQDKKNILMHGHCQQKAVASTKSIVKMLTIPTNYRIKEIPSGCCGMAGSFGYEKEHYELSMKIGEMVLFPEVRKAEVDTIIVASGTSCRHQIKDGTKREAKHPVEVLFNALI